MTPLDSDAYPVGALHGQAERDMDSKLAKPLGLTQGHTVGLEWCPGAVIKATLRVRTCAWQRAGFALRPWAYCSSAWLVGLSSVEDTCKSTPYKQILSE